MSEATTRHHADPEGAKIGMWLFLLTEVMLFGAMFIAFAVYLSTYTLEFKAGSAELHKLIGGANTIVLLTSSLTVALAIAFAHKGDRKKAAAALVATIALAGIFLVFKSFEWGEKLSHDIFPGSATMLQKTPGEQIFYGLYFAMTGLHGLHVLIGGAVISVALILLLKGRIEGPRSVWLTNVGLYWHFVDLVWIYLFPLFYLMR